MPRPVKCRKVCHFPNVLEFLPADNAEKKAPIVLTVDEYETIRLLDKKGYSQEQCAVSSAGKNSKTLGKWQTFLHFTGLGINCFFYRFTFNLLFYPIILCIFNDVKSSLFFFIYIFQLQ